MEDIKKIARKFVSESLADKLAQFVAQASQYITKDNSKENNASTDLVSDENNQFSDTRQRNEVEINEKSKLDAAFELDEANDDVNGFNEDNADESKKHEKPRISNTEYREREKSEQKRKEYEISNGLIENPYVGKNDNREDDDKDVRQQNENDQDKINEDLTDYRDDRQDDSVEEKRKPAKQYAYSLEPSFNKEFNTEQSKYIKKQRPVIESTRFDNWFATNNQKRFKSVLKSNRGTGKHNKERSERVFKALTTKKERNEFDQYDNIKNPNSDYVATSGPLVLRKLSRKKWGEEEEDRKKHWF